MGTYLAKGEGKYMRVSEVGDLVCPYRCMYSDDGICRGGLMQCCHLQERARVCLEDEKEFFEKQQRYFSEDEMDGQMYLQEMKKSIERYERILRADKIDVMVQASGQSYYKTVIDACAERKKTYGNVIVEYANGIGRTMQFIGGMVFGSGELYAEEIYYYEMKHIMDCSEIPGHKKILQEGNSTICFYYNPCAQKEGKPFNFSYDGKDIYGTVVFYKQVEKKDEKQTVSLGQRDIGYIENFLDKILGAKKEKMAVKANDGREYVVIPSCYDEACVAICGNTLFYVSICFDVIKTLGRELFTQKTFSRTDAFNNLSESDKQFYGAILQDAKKKRDAIDKVKDGGYEELLDAISEVALSSETSEEEKSQVFSKLTGQYVRFIGNKLYMENQEVQLDSVCIRAMKNICKDLDIKSMGRNEFYTKVVGVTQEKNRQLYASRCYVGQELELIRERTNPHDSNAIAVYAGNHQLGYIKKEIAAQLAGQIDCGRNFLCYVEHVTGGGDMFWGINIKIIEC